MEWTDVVDFIGLAACAVLVAFTALLCLATACAVALSGRLSREEEDAADAALADDLSRRFKRKETI